MTKFDKISDLVALLDDEPELLSNTPAYAREFKGVYIPPRQRLPMSKGSIEAQNSASIAVVEAVASAEDIDPADLEPRLHDSIDSVALDQLMSRNGVSVQFEYSGYLVTVDSTLQVTLQPQ